MARPRVAVLRPVALSPYEMAYVEPLLGAFEIEAFVHHVPTIGGSATRIPIRRLRWPDEPVWEALLGRPASLGNAFFARALGRRYRLPGLGRALRGFDLVHALETRGEASWQAARAKARLGFGLVLACSENIPAGPGEAASARRRRLFVQAAADRFLAISEASRAALLADGAPPDRIEVLPHGIDLERFCAAPPPRNDPPVVLYVGRLSVEKGVGVLVEAVGRLRAAGTPARLVVVGDGPLRRDLERAAGAAAFVGEVPFGEIHRFYREADVVAVPSVPTPGFREQWGFAAAEAMATGRAVVASDLGGLPEVVGDAGLLVPPGDAAALAAALGDLLADPARRDDLGARGAARVRARFDRLRIAERLAAVYRSLSSPARRRPV